MATQWYWRADDAQNGPISFRELVMMVRDERLSEDDLVRPHYSPDWQEAASVIGLFHMAGRGDVLARWEEERRREELARQESQTASRDPNAASGMIGSSDLEEMLSLAESLPEGGEPTWRGRLREVEQQRALEQQELSDELAFSQLQDQKNQAIAAAVASQESKAAASRSRWKWLVSATELPRDMIKTGIEWGTTLLVANLMAWGILSWSETEAMRFPDPQATALRLQPFPLWGPCTPEIYAFLLIDTVLVVGVLAFAGSRFLINLADD